VPLLLWGLTGVVFLFKPGYEGAYQKLMPKQYELGDSMRLETSLQWQEVRVLRTVLGYHLLVHQAGQWLQLDTRTLQERALPSESELEELVADAISSDVRRYGAIESIQNGMVITNTGVEITLDWSTMTFRQKGFDTRVIGALYKVHYLQWLGAPTANKVFAAIAIALLLSLSILGLRVYLKGR